MGALDVNGSPRGYLESYGPLGYVGMDIRPGPGVDLVDDICLYTRSVGLYDTILCLDTLEHIEKWREALHAMKALLRPGA